MLAERITTAIARKGITMSRACREAGLNYKTLHSQMTHGREIPFSTIVRIAKLTEMPLEYFSELGPELFVVLDDTTSRDSASVVECQHEMKEQNINMLRSGQTIGTDDILDWLHANNGRLENFDQIGRHVDLFHPCRPDDKEIRPHQLGDASLAKTSFGVEDTDHFEKILSQLSRKDISKLVIDHTRARQQGYTVTDEAVSVQVASEAMVVVYRRIIAAVRDSHGNDFNLVFARHMSSSIAA